MARLPVTEEIAGLKVRCTPMVLPAAEEMLPEIIELVAILLKEITKGDGAITLQQLLKPDSGTIDLERIAATLMAGGAYLGGGRLARLAPKLFATCAVALPDLSGVVEWHDMKADKERALVLDERPDAYFPILLFAGRVNFQRFFPSGLSALSRGGRAAGADGRPDEPTHAASS